MIKGIGIDSTEIDRFYDWNKQSREKLQKIFSDFEIDYCIKNKKKSPERFAARFAAKEAFFKALCQITPEHKVPFLTLCKSISVNQQTNRSPELLINWTPIKEKNPHLETKDLQVFISITHTNNTATAIVIVENRKLI